MALLTCGFHSGASKTVREHRAIVSSHRDGGDFAAQPPEARAWPQEGPGELGVHRPLAQLRLLDLAGF